MAVDKTLVVQRGDPISPTLWNRLVAAVRACRILSGDGVRLRSTPNGTIISFDGAAQTWAHPFQVSLVGTTAAFIRRGLINTIEPKIDGVPIGGTEDKPQPKLEFKTPEFDKDGRGYIALEVTCDEKWNVKEAIPVQVASLDTIDGKEPPEGSGGRVTTGGAPGLPGRKARHPLAMLRQRKSGIIELFQIEFFNLQHRVRANPNSEIARHFFWPA